MCTDYQDVLLAVSSASNSRVIQEISKWLRQDASFEAACEACGVSHSTAYEWAKRGALEFVDRERGRALREEDDLYAEFFRATRQAQGQAECEDLRHIRKGRANWQSRSWIQAKRYSARLMREELKKLEIDVLDERREARMEVEAGYEGEEEEIIPATFGMPDGAVLEAIDLPGYQLGSYSKVDGSPCERDEAKVEIWRSSQPDDQPALAITGVREEWVGAQREAGPDGREVRGRG